MHGITDDKILDRLTYGLDPIIGHEVLKENPQTFEKAYVLAKQVLQISNLVGEGGAHSKWHEPPNYAPMELDSKSAF